MNRSRRAAFSEESPRVAAVRVQKLCLYESRAEHAERLARIAQTDEERHAYLQIAAVWREISRTRRKLLRSRSDDEPA